MVNNITLSWAYRRGKEVLDKTGYTQGDPDARILLCHALEIDLNKFYTLSRDFILNQQQWERYQHLIKLRLARMPIAYIVGRKEFMSLPFFVDPSVLIPRPATELLVEKGLEFIKKTYLPSMQEKAVESLDEIESGKVKEGEGLRGSPLIDYKDSSIPVAGMGSSPLIADVGTGSGCIAVSMAFYNNNIKIIASDISSDAIKIADKNIKNISNLYKDKNINRRVSLLKSNLLIDYPPQLKGKFRLILSNPPYVTPEEYEELMEGVKNFEPALALCPPEDPLDLYQKLCVSAMEFLSPFGGLAVEIGFQQGEDVVRIFRQAGFRRISLYRDLEGFDRVVLGIKEPIS